MTFLCYSDSTQIAPSKALYSKGVVLTIYPATGSGHEQATVESLLGKFPNGIERSTSVYSIRLNVYAFIAGIIFCGDDRRSSPAHYSLAQMIYTMLYGNSISSIRVR